MLNFYIFGDEFRWDPMALSFKGQITLIRGDALFIHCGYSELKMKEMLAIDFGGSNS